MKSPFPFGRRRHAKGFTLIELMVAVAVVGIIAAVAFPSYLGSIRKSRRSEAFAALAAVQQTQERFRGSNSTYGTLADLAGINGSIAAMTPNGLYAITLANVTASGYTSTATAQGKQAADADCNLIAVKVTGGNLSYGSGNAAVDWTDAGRCWAK